MSMKRICIIDPVLTRYRLPIFEELSRYCQVDWVFSPSPGKSGFIAVPPTESPNMRYFRIPRVMPFGDNPGMFQWGITRYILAERPDAIKIFSNPNYLSFWSTLFVARALRIPVYAHGVGFFKRTRVGIIRRWMMKLILRMVTSYIAYAPVVRESLEAQGFCIDKLIVAPNSLINNYPVRPEEKTGSEQGILFIGRLRPRTGLGVLLRVVRRLRREGDFPWALHVVGRGEEEESLRRESSDCPWVTWHGDLDDQRVSEISRDCLLGCYAGSAGLSVVHMLSLSLPVIVHNDLSSHEGPEASYVHDGVNGFLFDHKVPEESLYRILQSVSRDPSSLPRIRDKAFEEYQSLVNPSYADRLRAIFDQGRSVESRILQQRVHD